MTERRRLYFRVLWEEKGNVRANRRYRVQFNNALGPYKGGLRFHPSVNLSILKFLGAQFQKRPDRLAARCGKRRRRFQSARQIRPRSFAILQIVYAGTLSRRHIGPNIALACAGGDIGVGEREVGYLFGQYKRNYRRVCLRRDDRQRSFAGSLIRREATGFGAAFFAEEMLAANGDFPIFARRLRQMPNLVCRQRQCRPALRRKDYRPRRQGSDNVGGRVYSRPGRHYRSQTRALASKIYQTRAHTVEYLKKYKTAKFIPAFRRPKRTGGYCRR